MSKTWPHTAIFSTWALVCTFAVPARADSPVNPAAPAPCQRAPALTQAQGPTAWAWKHGEVTIHQDCLVKLIKSL